MQIFKKRKRKRKYYKPKIIYVAAAKTLYPLPNNVFILNSNKANYKIYFIFKLRKHDGKPLEHTSLPTSNKYY